MIASIGSLFFLLFASSINIVELSTVQLWALGFATLNTAIAYGCFIEAMRHWETSRVSAVVAIVPVLTLIISYLQGTFYPSFIPPDTINTLSLLGAITIVSGSALTALAKSKKSIQKI